MCSYDSLKHICTWDKPLGQNDYPTEANFYHETFPQFNYFLLYLLKKFFFLLVVYMYFAFPVCVYVCVCVNVVLCLLQETPFFCVMQSVFVISTLLWTKKSSFSCEKEISQLFINCGVCYRRGQDFRKSSFSVLHVLLLLFLIKLIF